MSLIPIAVLMSLASSSPVCFFWVSDSFSGLMIGCLACTGRTGLMCLVFPRAGKTGALAALVAPVVPAVGSQAWCKTWEYMAGPLGPSRFVSPWTVLKSSLSPALISAMSWAGELLPDVSWVPWSTPGSLASTRAFLTYSHMLFTCSVGLLLVRKSSIALIASFVVSCVMYLMSSATRRVAGGLPSSIPAPTQRCTLRGAGSRF
jgi:hypothetical protein